MSEDQVGFRKERGTNIRDHAAMGEIYRTKQDIVQQLHRLRTDVSQCAAGRIVESNEILGVDPRAAELAAGRKKNAA